MTPHDKIKSILLIDDDTSVLTALKLLLEVMQLSPETCPSGAAAIERLAKGPSPDLVLCDLRMPGMDGFAVLSEIRRTNPALPFLLMSAHANKDEVARARALGANGFVAKPFSPDDLTAAIQKIC